jgi:hypothetical protein
LYRHQDSDDEDEDEESKYSLQERRDRPTLMKQMRRFKSEGTLIGSVSKRMHPIHHGKTTFQQERYNMMPEEGEEDGEEEHIVLGNSNTKPTISMLSLQCNGKAGSGQPDRRRTKILPWEKSRGKKKLVEEMVSKAKPKKSGRKKAESKSNRTRSQIHHWESTTGTRQATRCVELEDKNLWASELASQLDVAMGLESRAQPLPIHKKVRSTHQENNRLPS